MVVAIETLVMLRLTRSPALPLNANWPVSLGLVIVNVTGEPPGNRAHHHPGRLLQLRSTACVDRATQLLQMALPNLGDLPLSRTRIVGW